MDSRQLDRGISRRHFSRLLALGGSGTLIAPASFATSRPAPLSRLPESAGEAFWAGVREQFVMPASLTALNAANLCPSPTPVLDVMFESTRSIDRDPSANNREKTHEGKEAARRLLASFLRVTPEEIVITRNTSESNNVVSSGLDLKSGDEVLIFSDNHPSNHAAWREKARRFGFTVNTVDALNPHPGAAYYLEAFRKAMTPRTKVVALTHVTSTVGDVLPARELCRLARDRGALSLVDGAQSFGVLDVDLSDMQPDFYTGSAHKWPCGPKETGVLYVNSRVHPLISPSVISLYEGSVGISKSLEGFGQRDEPAIIGFAEALNFQTRIGRPAIERRSRELTQAFIEGLRRVEGIRVWTHSDPALSAAIVSFLPGSLDVRKLSLALYERDHIVCSTRTGQDRGGIRFSPHFYNLHSDVDRALGAIARYMKTGV